MFPLKNRKLIRGCAAHIKASLGCAADYEADYEEYRAPFSGTLYAFGSTHDEGGYWLGLKLDNHPLISKIEVAHLSKYIKKSGHIDEGTLIAITGNSGTLTSGPHAHIQAFNKQGKRIDPETINWNTMPIQMPFTAIANNLNVPSLSDSLLTVAEMMKTYSRNRINLPFDIKNTSFTSVPFAEELPNVKSPQINWYRENITPLCTGKASLFLMNDQQWQGNTTGAMTWGDPGKPGRINLLYVETTFVEQAFHELCHALLFFTGQKDGYILNGTSRFVVHDYLFQNPPDKYGLLDSVDYTKLQTALNGITPAGESMAKYFKVNDHGKLGIMILEGFSGTILFENEFADYQDLLKITEGAENAPTINIP